MKYSLADHGPKIEAFLNRILPLAGLDVAFELGEGETIHPEFENPEIRVKFSGPDVDELLSNKTEVLLALEHLTQEALHMPGEDHNKLIFDANDYRMLRIEELRASAEQAAERVKTTRQPFRFNPMNSRERRILHLALREETSLRSESEGFEPRRYVVIYPADMPSRPAPPPEFPRRGSGGGGAGGRGGDRGRDRGGRGRPR
ncbi:MAG: R3H domain-containing nucleic acid-binding protein [Bryobacteraceae bacterium]